MTVIIYWQEQPEFGSGHVSAMVDGEFDVFSSYNRLCQYLSFNVDDDYELFEVTPDNWQELYDSGAFRHG